MRVDYQHGRKAMGASQVSVHGYLAVFVGVLLLVACETTVPPEKPTAAPPEKVTTLPDDKARVIFAAPGLDGKIAQQLKTTHEGYQYTVDVAYWIGTVSYLPTAVVYYIHALPGYQFLSEGELRSHIKGITFLDEKDLRFESSHSMVNKLGRIKWRRFSFEDTKCVGFLQHFGFSIGVQRGVGTDRVYGYYCADPGRQLSDETLTAALKSLGIKGVAVP